MRMYNGWLLLLLFLSSISQAVAWEWTITSKNKADLNYLPAYCRGTQLIRDASGDKTPIETYMKQYGKEFWHLHHYCWAMNNERRSYSLPDKGDEKSGRPSRWSVLENAKEDLEYFLQRSSEDFIFLPDVLITNAKVLYQLNKKGEAFASLNRAIRIKPTYAPAYIQMSEYYSKLGDVKKAVQLLKEGLSASPGDGAIIKRLRKYGVEPEERYLVKPNEQGSKVPDSTEVKPVEIITHVDNDGLLENKKLEEEKVLKEEKVQIGGEKKEGARNGRFCRFCPD